MRSEKIGSVGEGDSRVEKEARRKGKWEGEHKGMGWLKWGKGREGQKGKRNLD